MNIIKTQFMLSHIPLFILQSILLKYYKIIIIFSFLFSHSPNHASCRHVKPNTPYVGTQPNHQNTLKPTPESTPRSSIITMDQIQIKSVNQTQIKLELNPLQNLPKTHNQLQNPPQPLSKLAGNPQLATKPFGNPYPRNFSPMPSNPYLV